MHIRPMIIETPLCPAPPPQRRAPRKVPVPCHALCRGTERLCGPRSLYKKLRTPDGQYLCAVPSRKELIIWDMPRPRNHAAMHPPRRIEFLIAAALLSGWALLCLVELMAARIRIIKHEAVPLCGSFEVCFSDGRPSHSSIGMTLRAGGCEPIWSMG
jgi:hypothetical protein